MEIPTLESERLILRALCDADADGFAEMMADARVARWVAPGGAPMDRANAWRMMASMLGHWMLRGFGMFAVEEKATGAFVGRVGPLEPEGHPALEIGWALHPAHFGKGYATEAAARTIDWVFATCDVDEISSFIDPLNEASARVALRLGETKSPKRFHHPFGVELDVWRLARSDWRGLG